MVVQEGLIAMDEEIDSFQRPNTQPKSQELWLLSSSIKSTINQSPYLPTPSALHQKTSFCVNNDYYRRKFTVRRSVGQAGDKKRLWQTFFTLKRSWLSRNIWSKHLPEIFLPIQQTKDWLIERSHQLIVWACI